jgi:hypothetical protein
MKTRSNKTALIFASALSAASLLPLAAALAGTAPNAATNATVASDTSHGIYDGADRFRDAMGYALPGWEVVVYGPNA